MRCPRARRLPLMQRCLRMGAREGARAPPRLGRRRAPARATQAHGRTLSGASDALPPSFVLRARWAAATEGLVAASTAPFLALALPQVAKNAANLAAGDAAALAGLPWLGYVPPAANSKSVGALWQAGLPTRARGEPRGASAPRGGEGEGGGCGGGAPGVAGWVSNPARPAARPPIKDSTKLHSPSVTHSLSHLTPHPPPLTLSSPYKPPCHTQRSTGMRPRWWATC